MRSNILWLLAAITVSFTSIAQSDVGEYVDNKFKYELPEKLNTTEYLGQLENKDSSYVLLDRSILCYDWKSSWYSRKWISHKVYYIGNESDIEDINRLYLYAGSSSNSVKVEVRTTTSDGREIYLDETKMEDVSREDGTMNYKILAISGIEKHSWVEVLVTRSNQSAHKRFSVSNPFPTKKAEVYVHAAKKVTKYDTKLDKTRFQTYGKFQSEDWTKRGGNFPEGYRDLGLKNDQSEGLRTPLATAIDVLPTSNENYSHEYQNYTYLDIVSLDYSWQEAGKGIGRNVFRGVDNSRTILKGKKILNELNLGQVEDLEKVRGIEKFIKEEIKETESGDDMYSDTKQIWKKRIANETGIIRMVTLLATAAELEYRVYLCSDKEYIQIDPDFAFTNGLDVILFYFPELDVYMAPTNGYYYTGTIPNYLASNNALVIRDRSSNQQLGEVVRLPEAKMENNLDGTRAVINIDPVEEICTVQKTKFLYGDRATRSRGYYHFSDDEDRKEYVTEWLLDDAEMELSDVEIRNEAIGLNFGSKDTVYYSGKLTGSDILTSIPNGFILNPGGIMGTQVSFYDTEDRVSDIYIPESKTYDHTIIVNIPEGYRVEGTENLEFDEKFTANKRWLYGQSAQDVEEEESNTPAAQFVATVEVANDQVRIEIDEYYLEGFYPKEGLEDFQKVVNAAYEFFIAKIRFVEQ